MPIPPETVLPLWESPAHPNVWHRVTAPGGYEWWHFDAEDAAGRLQVAVTFFDGYAFHPDYLRRYDRFRRRPTRHRPPQAREYPCVSFAAYENGTRVAGFVSQYPPGAFVAPDDRLDVRVGSSSFRRSDDGSFRVTVPEVRGEFTFRPVLDTPPLDRAFRAVSGTEAVHRWVIADPLCTVEGTIGLGGKESVTRFSGRGYHDHHYGTAPIGSAFRRWIRGRVLDADCTLTFQVAQPRNRDLPDDVQLVTADGGGVREVASSCAASWSRRNAAGLAYPGEMAFPNGLRLSAPVVVDSTPYSLRLAYEARTRDDAGRAVCEIVYPNRLTWPGVGRMVERSIRLVESSATPPGGAGGAP